MPNSVPSHAGPVFHKAPPRRFCDTLKDIASTLGAIRKFSQLKVGWNAGKATIHYNSGIKQMEKGSQAKAISLFSKALAIEPDYAAALANRGVCKLMLNDYAGGMSDLKEGIRLEEKRLSLLPPGSDDAQAIKKRLARAYYNLGCATALQECPKKMGELPKTLLPSYAQIENSGYCIRIRTLKSALKLFNACIVLDPSHNGAKGKIRLLEGYLDKHAPAGKDDDASCPK